MKTTILGLIIILLLSCSNNKHLEEEQQYPNCIFIDTGKINIIFPINSAYYDMYSKREDLNISQNGDTLYCQEWKSFYIKRFFNNCDISFDTLEFSNSISEASYFQYHFLFNGKIIGHTLFISLYIPSDSLKGTYRYNINDNELFLFKCIIGEIFYTLKKTYLPALDTNYFKMCNYRSAAIYFKFINKQNSIEYYGSTEHQELRMLMEYLITLNKIYIKPFNKISDEIDFMYIRDRFNYFQKKDNYTGTIVHHPDSCIPPLPK